MSWLRRIAVLVAALAAIGGAMFLFSDEKGAPVPYDYQGVECWKAGDLLECDRPGPMTDVFVRYQEGWVSPSSCRVVSPTLTRCDQPYAFELDSSGDYTKLRRLSDN